jgi:tryptophan-rich sensory protein
MGWIDWTLAGFVLVNVAAAMSGAVFKPGAWYESLTKPWWTPPNWAFPLVWTTIFAMIAVAGWRAHQVAGSLGAAPWAFGAYFAQLALNALWSAVFFGLRRPDLGLAEVALLWLAILINLVLFLAVDLWAGLLIVPYLAWVSLAANLNRSIWRLNPDESAWRPSPRQA